MVKCRSRQTRRSGPEPSIAGQLPGGSRDEEPEVAQIPRAEPPGEFPRFNPAGHALTGSDLSQKLRQSWNKYNLWNLKSFRLPRMMRRTFFQQKWSAKAMTRAYHGEHIKERQWERMFSRRLNTVVDMNPRYMAEHDGSEQASGRGSGRQPAPLPPNTRPSFEDEYQRSPSNKTKRGDTPTPYMQMTFAPLERRLDTAVFRAMFASSSRQARQFVVHGGVTVNGQTVCCTGPPFRLAALLTPCAPR